MYDFPHLVMAHDALWMALYELLNEFGVRGAPQSLTRHLAAERLWSHPRLLLGQACEYPLSRQRTAPLRVIATPRYLAPGCVEANYRSAILVRNDDPAETLSDLKGRRCVINDATSNSGMNLLRAAIAPLAQEKQFFRSVQLSGSHHQSMHAVALGQADTCAVDCVSFGHLRAVDDIASSLRVLAWTAATPSLPLVAASTVDETTVGKLRGALRAVAHDSTLRATLDTLLIEGFEFDPDPHFSRVLQLERLASRWGYSELH
jgi:ABC-type phosphate/phosphonate transport system substrate-binding protein